MEIQNNKKKCISEKNIDSGYSALKDGFLYISIVEVDPLWKAE